MKGVDITFFCVINSTDDCILLQTDTESTQGWCTANFMKLNSTTTVVIIFTRKTNVLYYKLWDSSITHADTTLGYNLNQNFISAHTGSTFSQFVRMLFLICTITYSFSNLDSLLILYLTMVRPKLEYASTVWNSIMSTNAKKLEHIHWKFVALCQYRFFTRDHGTYKDFLKFLNLYTLHNRRLYLDVIFLISVHSGLKCWILLVFEFFLLILETFACLLLLAITICQLKAFRLLAMCAKMLTSLENLLLH